MSKDLAPLLSYPRVGGRDPSLHRSSPQVVAGIHPEKIKIDSRLQTSGMTAPFWDPRSLWRVSIQTNPKIARVLGMKEKMNYSPMPILAKAKAGEMRLRFNPKVFGSIPIARPRS